MWRGVGERWVEMAYRTIELLIQLVAHTLSSSSASASKHDAYHLEYRRSV